MKKSAMPPIVLPPELWLFAGLLAMGGNSAPKTKAKKSSSGRRMVQSRHAL